MSTGPTRRSRAGTAEPAARRPVRSASPAAPTAATITQGKTVSPNTRYKVRALRDGFYGLRRQRQGVIFSFKTGPKQTVLPTWMQLASEPAPLEDDDGRADEPPTEAGDGDGDGTI